MTAIAALLKNALDLRKGHSAGVGARIVAWVGRIGCLWTGAGRHNREEQKGGR